MVRAPLDAERLRALVAAHLPEADVRVTTVAGNDHFAMTVISPAFAGKTRVERHRMVYAALGDHLAGAIHALALTTKTPAEWERDRP